MKINMTKFEAHNLLLIGAHVIGAIHLALLGVWVMAAGDRLLSIANVISVIGIILIIMHVAGWRYAREHFIHITRDYRPDNTLATFVMLPSLVILGGWIYALIQGASLIYSVCP